LCISILGILHGAAQSFVPPILPIVGLEMASGLALYTLLHEMGAAEVLGALWARAGGSRLVLHRLQLGIPVVLTFALICWTFGVAGSAHTVVLVDDFLIVTTREPTPDTHRLINATEWDSRRWLEPGPVSLYVAFPIAWVLLSSCAPSEAPHVRHGIALQKQMIRALLSTSSVAISRLRVVARDAICGAIHEPAALYDAHLAANGDPIDSDDDDGADSSGDHPSPPEAAAATAAATAAARTAAANIIAAEQEPIQRNSSLPWLSSPCEPFDVWWYPIMLRRVFPAALMLLAFVEAAAAQLSDCTTMLGNTAALVHSVGGGAIGLVLISSSGHKAKRADHDAAVQLVLRARAGAIITSVLFSTAVIGLAVCCLSGYSSSDSSAPDLGRPSSSGGSPSSRLTECTFDPSDVLFEASWSEMVTASIFGLAPANACSMIIVQAFSVRERTYWKPGVWLGLVLSQLSCTVFLLSTMREQIWVHGWAGMRHCAILLVLQWGSAALGGLIGHVVIGGIARSFFAIRGQDRDLQRSKQELDQLPPAPCECIICLDAPVTHLFVPCGHMVACARCAEMVMRNAEQVCPVCRTPASSVCKFFA